MPVTVCNTSKERLSYKMPNSQPVGSRFRLASLSPVEVKSSYELTRLEFDKLRTRRVCPAEKLVHVHLVEVEPSATFCTRSFVLANVPSGLVAWAMPTCCPKASKSTTSESESTEVTLSRTLVNLN